MVAVRSPVLTQQVTFFQTPADPGKIGVLQNLHKYCIAAVYSKRDYYLLKFLQAASPGCILKVQMSDSPYDPEQNYSQFRRKPISDDVSFEEWLEFGKKQQWRIPVSMFQIIDSAAGDPEKEKE